MVLGLRHFDGPPTSHLVAQTNQAATNSFNHEKLISQHLNIAGAFADRSGARYEQLLIVDD
jgi:hypothetical protein